MIAGAIAGVVAIVGRIAWIMIVAILVTLSIRYPRKNRTQHT